MLTTAVQWAQTCAKCLTLTSFDSLNKSVRDAVVINPFQTRKLSLQLGREPAGWRVDLQCDAQTHALLQTFAWVGI